MSYSNSEKEGVEIILDWRKYDNNNVSFESVTHTMNYVPNYNKRTGTDIYIEYLRDKWTEKDLVDLYEDLIFLQSPNPTERESFKIYLYSDEYPDINGRIESAQSAKAEFQLKSHLKSDGHITHHIKHKGKEYKNINNDWNEIDSNKSLFNFPPECGEIKLEILFYVKPEAKLKRSPDIRDKAFQKYLKTHRGIKIYRDGFIVKPYGLKNNDWLGLDNRKMKNNEGVVQAKLGKWSIANYQIIGAVTISRSANEKLEDKTNREGLIENKAFRDLKKFILSSIKTLEIERQIYEKNARQAKKDKAINDVEPEPAEQGNIEAIVEKIDTQLNSNSEINPEKQVDTDQSVVTLSKQDAKALLETANQYAQLASERELLNSLSTIGIVFVTFSHEIKGDALKISRNARILKKAEFTKSNHEEKLSKIIDASDRLEDWAEIILHRVQSNRRVSSSHDIIETIEKIATQFEGVINNIKLEFDNSESLKYMANSIPMEIESVVMNLISNSIKAFQRSSNESRQIIIKTNRKYNELLIHFIDSATGIRSQGHLLSAKDAEIIFDPLTRLNEFNDSESSTFEDNQEGAGMGLSIVKNICHVNDWQIDVIPLNSIGGATFVLKISGGKFL